MGRIVYKHMTLAKTLTYGTMHVTVAVAVAYVITRNLALSLSLGLIEPAVQTCCFYAHEKGWIRAHGWLARRYGLV
jgi:uncharacterized membrane protein